MKRLITTGSLILLIQCALVAVVYWPDSKLLEPVQQTLGPFVPDTVDEIYVSDAQDNEAVLLRSGDRWQLPDLDGLPADAARVGKLLAAMSATDTGWPVARSSAARQRFQVADYHYQRRLTLIGDGQLLGTVYLGTSPGYRQVHARNDAQDDIYAIAFNTFEARARSGDWLDRKLLQIRTPLRIAGDDYSLHREGEEWISATGQAPEQRELDALLSTLRSMQVEGIASQDGQRDLSDTEANLVLQVESLAGNHTLELYTLDGRHYIYSSEYALFFRLSAYDFDRLAGIDGRLLQPDP